MPKAESVGGHELALAIINDGAGYRARCRIEWKRTYAPAVAGQITQAAERAAALAWLDIALQGARAYERQFGTPGTSSFTAHDILCTAAECADYYARHLAEAAPHERARMIRTGT